jgi:hypothetical protein
MQISRLPWYLLPLMVGLAAAGATPQAAISAAASSTIAAFSPRDFGGVWVRPSGGRYRPAEVRERERQLVRPESEWSSERLPFTEAGRAAFEANEPTGGPRQVRSRVSANDPRDRGNPLGLFRTLHYVGNTRPMEMGVFNGNIVQVFSVGKSWRTIFMDGRPVPQEVAAGPYWFGYSVGHWEGDTLVVETLALDERQWLDAYGTPISADARVVEKWRRVSASEMQLTITVNDPTYYTKPWTSVSEMFIQQGRGCARIDLRTRGYRRL